MAAGWTREALSKLLENNLLTSVAGWSSRGRQEVALVFVSAGVIAVGQPSAFRFRQGAFQVWE